MATDLAKANTVKLIDIIDNYTNMPADSKQYDELVSKIEEFLDSHVLESASSGLTADKIYATRLDDFKQKTLADVKAIIDPQVVIKLV